MLLHIPLLHWIKEVNTVPFIKIYFIQHYIYPRPIVGLLMHFFFLFFFTEIGHSALTIWFVQVYFYAILYFYWSEIQNAGLFLVKILLLLLKEKIWALLTPLIKPVLLLKFWDFLKIRLTLMSYSKISEYFFHHCSTAKGLFFITM